MKQPEDAATWRRVRAAFEEACELEPRERSAYLDGLRSEDADLRRRVEQLLAADEDCDEFLEPLLPADAVAGLEGRNVGGFRVLRVLAEGGMGTVYEAEQEHPQRRVALKTMRSGLASSQSRRRFRYEGELLARLRHPNIAQVLGAGVLELEGSPDLPWLALELVEDARPLNALSTDGSFTLEERLRLFLTTCDAVHHAHLRGVLHRDLKGANVLVNGEGHVKVIDFGIARPLGGESPNVTRSGEVIGTLASMAPEQLGGAAGEVDARADVYALGVLLHELVSGRPPYELKGLSLAEAVRVVEHNEPSAPSHFVRSLPRDLDWIVARALAKNPGERYAAVSELAADVQRLLDDEPVQAGPPSTVYRLRKVYRRHRLAVVAAVGVLAALVAGLVGTSVGLVQARESADQAWLSEQDAKRAEGEARTAEDQARSAEQEARSEADLAKQLFQFFQDGLAAPDPRQRGRELTMFDFLMRTAEGVDARFEERPLVAGQLHRTIGRSLHGLGEDDVALQHLVRSVELLEGIDTRAPNPQTRRELLAGLGNLADVQMSQGKLEDAERNLARVETLLEAEELDAQQQARLDTQRGRLLLEQGHLDEAAALLRAAIAELPEGNDDALRAASILGGALLHAGRTGEAIDVYRAALRSVEVSQDMRLVVYLNNSFAMALQENGQREEATVVLEQLLPEQEAMFGPTHPDVIGARSNLAALYYLQGREPEAIPLWNASLAALEGELPGTHPVLQVLRVNIGVAELEHGDPARGEALLRSVWTMRMEQFGPDDERTLKVQYELAQALRLLDSMEEALELAEDAAYRLLTNYGDGHATLPFCELVRAEILAKTERDEEALEAYEVLRDDLESGRRDTSLMSLAELEDRIRELSDEH